MTFPTPSGSTALALSQESPGRASQGLLPQSRETGEVVPSDKHNGSPTAKKEAPVVKPWAHFVAGGQVIPITSSEL